MTHDDYRALSGVNFSTLKHISDSPAHYAAALRAPRADTPALRLGRAVHTLTFEPHRWDDEYAVFPGRRAGKAWDEFVEVNAGRTLLNEAEADEAIAVSTAVRTSPLVAPYLSDGVFERVIQWTDEATGIVCKGKIDWLVGDVLIDLKTARSIDRRQFGQAMASYHVPAQLTWYADGMAAIGDPVSRLLIVGAEKQAPHDVGVFELDAEGQEIGRADWRAWLDALQRCRESGVWPGRYEFEEFLTLPGWLFARDSEDPADFDLNIGE